MKHGFYMLMDRARTVSDTLAVAAVMQRTTERDVPSSLPSDVEASPTDSAVLGRKLSTLAALIRRDPAELIRTLCGRAERYVAFVADPNRIRAPEPRAGWKLRKIDDDVLVQLTAERPEFRVQTDRLARGRVNDAYGLFIDDQLAGITWMIPSEHDARYAVRNVKLRANEVELTHCLTLPEFRIRGVYTYLIRALCTIARENGVRRVYMITSRANSASQIGIQKAGFTRTGGIYRHVFDFIGPRASITFRRHRWGVLGWK